MNDTFFGVKVCQNQMLFIEVTQAYSNRAVYLCNAILVTEIFRYRYSTIDNSANIQHFQRNLAIVSAIYWGLSVQNFIQIRFGLAFLLYDVYGVTFFLTQCRILGWECDLQQNRFD